MKTIATLILVCLLGCEPASNADPTLSSDYHRSVYVVQDRERHVVCYITTGTGGGISCVQLGEKL